MNLKEFIQNVATLARTRITALAQEQISNTEKKELLDRTIYSYVEKIIDTIGVNFIVKLVLKKVLLPNIATITQIIYDLLKAKINGVTEVWVSDESPSGVVKKKKAEK